MSNTIAATVRIIAWHACILMTYSTAATEWLVHRAPLTEEGPIPGTQLMLIFIDDSEITMEGSFTRRAAAALYLNSCPILVSGSILRNIIAHRHYDFQLASLYKQVISIASTASVGSEKSIMEKLDKASDQIPPSSNDIALSIVVTQFDPGKWLWYKVNSLAYLLIPTNQIPSNKIKSDTDKVEQSVTMRELTIGLKIDHLEKQEYETVRKELVSGATITDSSLAQYLKPQLSSATGYFVNILEEHKVFVPQFEYYKAKKLELIKQWVIYIGGHGSLGHYIADLSIKQFRALLNFIEKNLLMRLLLVNSCYASGTNSVLIYNDWRNIALRQKFSFPIINSSLPDYYVGTTFSQNSGFILDKEKNNIKPDLAVQYSQLINLLNQNNPITYYEFLKKIHIDLFDPSNTDTNPLIRPAHRDAFFPLFFMLEIGTVMAQNRTQPLLVNNMVKQRLSQKKYIPSNRPLFFFLTSKIIPFEVDFTGITQQVFFISGIPGPDKIMHTFNSITLEGNDNDLCKKKFKLLNANNKWLYIKSLKQKTPEKAILYADAIVDNTLMFARKLINEAKSELIVMQEKLNIYTQERKCIIRPQTEQEQQRYAELLQQAQQPSEIQKAIDWGNYSLIKSLVQSGHNIPYQAFTEATTKNSLFGKQLGTLVFQDALKKGDLLLAEEALDKGADIHNQEILNQAAFIVALQQHADIEFLKKLLQKNALRDKSIHCAILREAAFSNQGKIIPLLVQHFLQCSTDQITRIIDLVKAEEKASRGIDFTQTLQNLTQYKNMVSMQEFNNQLHLLTHMLPK